MAPGDQGKDGFYSGHAEAVELLGQLAPGQGSRDAELGVGEGASQHAQAKKNLLATCDGTHRPLHRCDTLCQCPDLPVKHIQAVVIRTESLEVELPVELWDAVMIPETLNVLRQV